MTEVRLIFIFMISLFATERGFLPIAQGFDFKFGRTGVASSISSTFSRAKNALKKEAERQKKAQREEDQKNAQRSHAADTTRIPTTDPTPTAADQVRNGQTNDSRFVFEQTYPIDSRWILIKISKGKYYQEFLFSVVNGKVSIPLYLKSGEGNYLLDICVSNDPEKLSKSYICGKKLIVTNHDQRDLSFLLPSDNVQSDDLEIINLSKELVTGLNNDSEKVKAIHDYVASIISYDMERYLNGTYASQATDAISVLRNLKTICSGYSNLFAALTRAAHIRTAVIFGKAKVKEDLIDHAWNEVFVDNEWKIVDVTWDDAKTLRYDYFFPTAEQFSKDHLKVRVLDKF